MTNLEYLFMCETELANILIVPDYEYDYMVGYITPDDKHFDYDSCSEKNNNCENRDEAYLKAMRHTAEWFHKEREVNE